MRIPLAVLGLMLAACAAPAAVRTAPSPTPAIPSSAPPAYAATAAPLPAASAVPATLAPSPTPVVLPLCPARSTVAGGVVRLCTEGAEIAVDASIAPGEMAAIVAQVREDVAAVQREFAWTLRAAAEIHVLADRDRYIAGLRELFGYGAATAEFVADNSVAFFEPSIRIIAVNWDAVRDRRPIAALRHELTHIVTLEACAPRCDLVPAWLNEGQARLAEALIPGADWRLMRVRYEAASMVATGTLLPLSSLWTQAQWNGLADWIGYYKYQEAARATELLRSDIGEGAIAKIYERLRRGEDVPRAYAALSGRPFDAFTRDLAARIVAAVPVERGIAVIAPGADGGGASYLLYGFAPEAKVTLRVASRYRDETVELSVSPQGALFGSIDDSYPPGRYTITATTAGGDVSATIQKRGGRPNRSSLEGT